MKYNTGQVETAQRHRRRMGPLAGLPIRLRGRLAATHQAEAPDILPDAIFVDLTLPGVRF